MPPHNKTMSQFLPFRGRRPIWGRETKKEKKRKNTVRIHALFPACADWPSDDQWITAQNLSE